MPARGLGQYSMDTPRDGMGHSPGRQQPLHESAAPLAIPELALDSTPHQQELGQEQTELTVPHQAASRPGIGADAAVSPGVWPAPTGQLRAARAHLRARRRPQLEGPVQQDSQESQPAVETTDTGQLQHPQQTSAVPSSTNDQQAEGQEPAPGGAAAPQQLGSSVEPDTAHPQELTTDERDQPFYAPSAPADRSEAERRRRSQEFIAQITEQARQMRAALHNSTSSSEQRQEGDADAPEDMQADSPGVEAAVGQTETEDDETEPDIVVDLSSPSPLKPSPAAHFPAPSSTPPVPVQLPLNTLMHLTEQSGSQHGEPGTAALTERQSCGPDLKADMPRGASAPPRASQHTGSQGSQLGAAAMAQAQSDRAGVPSDMPINSSSSPRGGQHSAPQQSQPASSAAREAASPHSDRVGIRLEYRPDLDVSPVRLSLNLDLTASSKQTPPQASAQTADSDSASPAHPPGTAPEAANSPPSASPMPNLSTGPTPGVPALNGQAQGSASRRPMGSAEPVHEEHPTPMTAQPAHDTEALQLSNVPLSALHPRGLFMSQAVEEAPGHLIADLNASPQHIALQEQPLGLAGYQHSSERQEMLVGSAIPGRMSQGSVDRHSDHSAAAQPSDEMHDDLENDRYRGNSQEAGLLNIPSQPLGSPVSMEVDAAEAAEGDVEEDQVLLHGTVRSSGSKLHAFRPRCRPPTREELQSSMAEHGILEIQYQGAFYGNPSDVPERPIGRHFCRSYVWQVACTH